jgi:hypothetical protein
LVLVITFYISIEKDRISSEHHKSPRYKARIRTTPDGHVEYIGSSAGQSVDAAKARVESVFGLLEWSAGVGDVRLTATVNLEVA